MGFPMNPPMTAIDHLIEYARGQGDHELGGLIEDAYDVLGYCLFLGFGSHNDPIIRHVNTGMPQFAGGEVFKQEAFAQELEKLKQVRKGAGPVQSWIVQALWAMVQQLISEWLSKKEGQSNPVANMGQRTVAELEKSGAHQLKPENSQEVARKASEVNIEEAQKKELEEESKKLEEETK